ncbi:hypothetical protein LXL04_035001 [Taraxacum kok-saghyz]
MRLWFERNWAPQVFDVMSQRMFLLSCSLCTFLFWYSYHKFYNSNSRNRSLELKPTVKTNHSGVLAIMLISFLNGYFFVLICEPAKKRKYIFSKGKKLGMSLSTQEKLMVPGVTGDSKDKEAKLVYDNLILRVVT